MLAVVITTAVVSVTTVGATLPDALCPGDACRAAGSWVAPMTCPHPMATQGFGNTPWEHPHLGVDIACPPGTPVVAAAAGYAHRRSGGSALCLFPAGQRGGLGNYVELDVRGVSILYGHLEAFAVADGARVAAGAVVGFEGTSGCSSGFHLHVQVEINGRATDPCPFLPAGYPAPHTNNQQRCWGAAPP